MFTGDVRLILMDFVFLSELEVIFGPKIIVVHSDALRRIIYRAAQMLQSRQHLASIKRLIRSQKVHESIKGYHCIMESQGWQRVGSHKNGFCWMKKNAARKEESRDSKRVNPRKRKAPVQRIPSSSSDSDWANLLHLEHPAPELSLQGQVLTGFRGCSWNL